MQVIRELKKEDNDPWFGTGDKVGRVINKEKGGWINVLESWLVVNDSGTMFNIVRYKRVGGYGKVVEFGAVAFRGKKGNEVINDSWLTVPETNYNDWKVDYLDYLERRLGV